MHVRPLACAHTAPCSLHPRCPQTLLLAVLLSFLTARLVGKIRAGQRAKAEADAHLEQRNLSISSLDDLRAGDTAGLAPLSPSHSNPIPIGSPGQSPPGPSPDNQGLASRCVAGALTPEDDLLKMTCVRW